MKVLIVDDEYFARKSIAKMLESLPHVEIIGQADSGEAAIAIMMKTLPDVMIADVRMAEMDGIQLCSYVKEHYPDMRVIIASGYADFDYARQAIDLNVRKYLLKPIEAGELLSCLTAFEQEMEKFREDSLVQGSEINRLRRIHMVYALLSEKELLAHDQQELSAYLGHYWLILLKSQGVNQVSGEIVAQLPTLSGSFRLAFYNDTATDEICALYTGGQRQELQKNLDALCGYVRQQTGSRVVVGVSGENRSLGTMGTAYRQAKNALRTRLLNTEDYIFYTQPSQPAVVSRVDTIVEIRLGEYLQRGQSDKAVRLIHRVLQEDVDGGSAAAFAAGYHRIAGILAAEGKKQSGQTVSLPELDSFWSLEEVQASVQEVILEAFHGDQDAEQDVVAQVLGIIDREYYGEISLGELAKNVFFMNFSYLSRLIKRKTGKNFSQLLLDKRMQVAWELLGEEKLSVYEVAYLVGYNKPSHFTDTYKKYYGMTPGHLRRMESKK